MNVHGPARRADRELDGHSAAMRRKPVTALPASHPVGGAAAVELRSTLAQAEQRAFADLETDDSCSRIHLELLHQSTALGLNPNGQRVRGKPKCQVAAFHAARSIERTQLGHWRPPIVLSKRAVRRYRLWLAMLQRPDRHSGPLRPDR